MNLRVVLLLVLAAGTGLGAVRFAQGWLDRERAELEAAAAANRQTAERPAATEVLVAAAELPAGHLLRGSDLRWQPWPEEGLADAYLLRDETDLEGFAGAVVRSRLVPGEPLTADRAVKPGDRGFLAAVLQPGLRAVAVPVDATKGVAGLVVPGDRVDLVLTHLVREEEGAVVEERPVGETVLENVRILAVDQVFDDSDKQTRVARNVTIEVTPKQAEAVAVMLEFGDLFLSLRSLAADDTPGDLDPAELRLAAQGNGPGGVEARPFTVDSDVSSVLTPPHFRSSAAPGLTGGTGVTIYRGRAGEEEKVQ